MKSKLSIITINLNNFAGLQKTMQSIFTQTFTAYEYIIIDGGSTDGCKEYIKQHSEKLTYWISEPDKGIYNAMNKGIEKANGDYVYFLNSGDYFYSQNIVENVISQLNDKDIYYGNIVAENAVGARKVYKFPPKIDLIFFSSGSLSHQAIFTRRTLFDEFGPYREDLRILSDWDFYAKRILVSKSSYNHLDFIIAVFNLGGISSNEKFEKVKNEELIQIKNEIYPLEVWNALVDVKKELQEYKTNYHGLINSGLIKLALQMIYIKKRILSKLKFML